MSKNLGNVAGVVRGVDPPLEADGTTVKKYVLWAKTLATIPESYELHYFDVALNNWVAFTGAGLEAYLLLRQQIFGTLNDPELLTALGFENLLAAVVNKNTVPFGKFTIYKKSGNTSADLEAGDIIQGFFSENKFVMAVYNTGNVNNLASYTMLNELDF